KAIPPRNGDSAPSTTAASECRVTERKRKWYRRAAESGYAKAQNSLGSVYQAEPPVQRSSRLVPKGRGSRRRGGAQQPRLGVRSRPRRDAVSAPRIRALHESGEPGKPAGYQHRGRLWRQPTRRQGFESSLCLG